MRTNMGHSCIRTLFLFLAIIFFFEARAQSDDFFVITGRLSSDDGKSDDVHIAVTKNGADEQQFSPSRSGRFRFEFAYNNEFHMTFLKEGYYKKTIVVSTHVPQAVLEENSDFPPFQIEVSLVKEIPGIDKSFTNKPAGRVFYNANIDNFDSEVFFSDIQLEEQAANARQQEQQLTAEQRAALAQREADYKKSIADADRMIGAEKYEDALTKFEYASGLFPERPYPKDRIAELQDLVSALKLAEERRRASDAAFLAKVAEGDKYMDQQEYQQAKESYTEALALRPDDSYAKSQLAHANGLLRQQEIDLQYNQLVAEAQELYDAGSLEAAKERYLEALKLHPEEAAFLNGQIQKIDNELAAQIELAQREQRYNEFMEQGSEAMQRENYNDALVAFRQALTNKPNDELATQKIGEVEEILLQLQKRENYDQYIVDADAAFQNKELPKAKGLYQQALNELPDEDYPKQQIAAIDQQQALNEQFDQLVAQADQQIAQENFAEAKALLEQALAIRDESALRDRIQELDIRLAQIKLDNDYADLLKRADVAKTNEEYALAKQLYNEALSLKEDETYPAEQIQEIDALLAQIAEQKQLDEQFNSTMEQAQAAFDREDYPTALKGFQAALSLKPDNQLARDRIDETEEIILQLEKKQQYDEIIAQADAAFGRSELNPAKELYQQALTVLPAEAYPKQQIEAINQQIREEEARQLALAQEQQRNYDVAVQEGDSLLALEQYEPAKLAYQKALSIKPEEDYPRKKISEIEGELARLAKLTAAYNKAIDQANALAKQESYEAAREKYVEALQYLPNEAYPKNQITRIDEILAQIAAEKKREADYLLAVQAGDSLLNLEEYQPAKDQFLNATALKPNERYPKDKVAEINRILEQLERERIAAEVTRKAYDEAIARADGELAQKQYVNARMSYEEALNLIPEETYPKDQIALINQLIEQEKESAYQAAIASGDQLLQGENYSESKSAYNEALKIKPEDPYATGQIAKITAILEQLAQDRLQRERLQKEYDDKIEDADQKFAATAYPEAKGLYEQALTILPEETYPKEQIARIDSLLLEIQKQQEVDQAYTQAIRNGQQAFDRDELDESLGFYREANTLKPEEQLPPKRIAEIEALIAQRAELARLAAEEEAQRQAMLQAKQQQYDQALANAQAAFDQQQYADAIEDLEAALAIFPDEQFPKDRIAQIELLIEQQKRDAMAREQQARQDSILRAQQLAFDQQLALGEKQEMAEEYDQAIATYTGAKSIVPARAGEADQRIERVREKIRAKQELEAKYASAIQAADRFFNNEELEKALTLYQEALGYKSDATYPQERIRLINQRLGELENRYAAAIEAADRFFTSEEWLGAKGKYAEALTLKPEEQYPADQLRLVNEKLAALQQAEQEQAQRDLAYQKAIAEADQAFAAQQYVVARSGFELAKSIKPEETYPDERIAEIDRLLAQQAREQQLADQQQALNAKYNEAIAAADREFQAARYESAKGYYESALTVKPGEQYPSIQLKRIAELVAMQQAAQAQKAVEVEAAPVPEKVVTLTDDYDEMIRQADESFDQEDYKIAQYYYQKALNERPNESYPKERLAEIRDLINQTLSQQELADYENALKLADQAFADKQYNIARFYYYKALGIKSWEQYPKDQLLEIQRLTDSLLSQLKEKEYQDLIAKADEAFVRKDYSISRAYYNRALSVKPKEQYPDIRLKEISSQLAMESANADEKTYQDLITRADQAMSASNYSIARFYYQKALGVKPREEYPKKQLQVIKESLKQANN